MTTTEHHDVKCRCDDCIDYWHSYHERDEAPLEACQLCNGDPLPHNEPRIQTIPCHECHELKELTGKTQIVDRADPTEAYELVCGHWVI